MTQQLAVRRGEAEFAEEPESHPNQEARPNIVVTGRRVVVPEHFREHVAEKMARLEKFDAHCHRVEVELAHESNPRQSKQCQRVQVTVLGKGPVVRAEARAETFYAALDLAADKIIERLRRSKDRRQVHHGQHRPTSVAEATANGWEPEMAPAAANGGPGSAQASPALGASSGFSPARGDAQADKAPSGPGQIVRVKSHPTSPMGVEDALNRMELVGHDFYLFHDKETGLPSVVYRRRGYDYGLIRLEQQ
ncbi:ribosomal subunit interface protein [Segniliparus rotundus DSM 44985]|uniref:Ribosome hibernation promoting factor n=1 Tax=Segniliparus rotundus (strain ATCC BAA-972 / CDC 1076 / CIP 108378 / DSM 44985 / JCM 13578) TaxID=640132 RepID=D6Z9Z0_SEGRD|nr:ribosome-associated translation inhibitor RaiA [Segniliparus rotundus]ADG98660.1 ribosomal subunit interface protein [Segniliparus rotundus DSM 44985]